MAFAGTSVPGFRFGTYDQINEHFTISTPISGILGLGEFYSTGPKCADYEGFIQQLFERGVITKRAFSVYLGPDEPNATGTLLLGGIDRAKRTGPVTVLPVVTPNSTVTNDTPFNMNYTSMAFVSDTGNTTTFPIAKGSFAPWDTGTPAWNIPQAAFEAVLQYFELPANSSDFGNPFPVDCKFRQPTNTTLEVELLDGFVVSIPLHRLVTQLNSTACNTYVRGLAGDGGGVGVNGWADPFLRSVYVTFDLDDAMVTVSNVRYTDEEDIVAI
jgi:hypothetical protein